MFCQANISQDTSITSVSFRAINSLHIIIKFVKLFKMQTLVEIVDLKNERLSNPKLAVNDHKINFINAHFGFEKIVFQLFFKEAR